MLRNSRRVELLTSAAIVVLSLLLWEWAARAGAVRAVFFPPPSRIWLKFLQLAGNQLFENTYITLLRVIAAFVVAAVPGVAVGLLMGVSPTVRAGLGPIIGFIYPVPSILWLPAAAAVLGMGNAALVLTGSVSSFFLVALTTMAGVIQISPVLLEAGRNYGARGWRFFAKVLLPGAMPFIFSGLRLGLGFSIIVVLALEIRISSMGGLGGYMFEAWGMLRVDYMYATLMVVAVLGLLSSNGVDWLGRRLMPWRIELERGGLKRG